MTQGPDPLAETFRHVADGMRSAFALSGRIHHRGSKGSAREEIVQKFLADFLPGVAEVTGNAELISTNGELSGQCDILVVDASTPRLWSSETVRTVPIESCYAWVEVKSTLTVAELRSAWKAAVKVKQMPRTAYFPSLVSKLFGSAHEIPRQILRDAVPLCSVFAYSGASAETLQAVMNELAAETGVGMGLDSVYILDQGFITWTHEGAADVYFDREYPGAALGVYKADQGQVLFAFTAFLNNKLAEAEVLPRLNFTHYIAKSFGASTGRLMRPSRVPGDGPPSGT